MFITEFVIKFDFANYDFVLTSSILYYLMFGLQENANLELGWLLGVTVLAILKCLMLKKFYHLSTGTHYL